MNNADATWQSTIRGHHLALQFVRHELVESMWWWRRQLFKLATPTRCAAPSLPPLGSVSIALDRLAEDSRDALARAFSYLLDTRQSRSDDANTPDMLRPWLLVSSVFIDKLAKHVGCNLSCADLTCRKAELGELLGTVRVKTTNPRDMVEEFEVPLFFGGNLADITTRYGKDNVCAYAGTKFGIATVHITANPAEPVPVRLDVL